MTCQVEFCKIEKKEPSLNYILVQSYEELKSYFPSKFTCDTDLEEAVYYPDTRESLKNQALYPMIISKVLEYEEDKGKRIYNDSYESEKLKLKDILDIIFLEKEEPNLKEYLNAKTNFKLNELGMINTIEHGDDSYKSYTLYYFTI